MSPEDKAPLLEEVPAPVGGIKETSEAKVGDPSHVEVKGNHAKAGHCLDLDKEKKTIRRPPCVITK